MFLIAIAIVVTKNTKTPTQKFTNTLNLRNNNLNQFYILPPNTLKNFTLHHPFLPSFAIDAQKQQHACVTVLNQAHQHTLSLDNVLVIVLNRNRLLEPTVQVSFIYLFSRGVND